MNPTRRLITTAIALTGVLGVSHTVVAKGKPQHKNGAKLLGEKLKSNGHHVLEKKGPHTVSVEVKDGKIAGVHVKHDKKGVVKVTKYKT
ncbi:MAG: hypothetical protein ABIR26_07165, partial [Ramlibacter sp.]